MDIITLIWVGLQFVIVVYPGHTHLQRKWLITHRQLEPKKATSSAVIRPYRGTVRKSHITLADTRHQEDN